MRIVIYLGVLIVLLGFGSPGGGLIGLPISFLLKMGSVRRPPVAVETDLAIVAWRGADDSFLVDLSPLKNLVHGRLRTCEW
jgi:hypothetical protein